MSQDLENYLKNALKKLEKAYEEIVKTQGFDQNAEKLKLLCELAREQVSNENTNHSTRQIR